MSIEHGCNDVAKGLARVACMLVLVLTACDTGPSGREEECGNNVVDPGEACDGADLGGGTCMDEVQRGGVLRCTTECTFDTSGCTLASCGNGVVEEGERCDGTELGGATCGSIGYVGGDLACGTDCVYETTACCNNSCPTAGQSECVGNMVRECKMAASGCLAWEVTDCGATNDVCETAAGAASCTCVDVCSNVGDTRCEGATIETCAEVDGCLDWQQTMMCGAGNVCAEASAGPVCVSDATAEDCTDPFPLSPGENIVAWTALNSDYLTSQPSCNSSTLTGPDLVLSYTAPEDGFIRFTMNKPASARQVVVVSSEACGTVAPELDCMSDFSPTTLTTELGVDMGTTYYFYVRDTTSGSAELDKPLIVDLEEALCSTLTPTVAALSPANGTSTPDLTPIFSADFEYPINASAGVITVTGNMGTSLTYDLATGPAAIAVINGGTTLMIDPGIVFPAGETVTITWTGIMDATCAKPVAAPTWTFDVTGPPCAPGVNGMVGNTITRVPTGLSSFTEYYVAADTSPTGYVYVGGTGDLHRTPKAGGTTENVETAAALTTSHLGYDMIVLGDEIYTLESNFSATTNVLWRISTNGGTTWAKENYMTLSQTPNDDLRAITHHEGRFYMTTDEFTGAEIWSVPAGAATVPQNATLEATITGEYYCDGVAVDDAYYYLACSNGDRLIRVDRTTLAVELITDSFFISSTKDSLHAHDFDADGRADALYLSSYYEEVYYVCNPSGTGPFFSSVLASFGSSSSNYGLGFDPVNAVLWMFDDDTREFVKIE